MTTDNSKFDIFAFSYNAKTLSEQKLVKRSKSTLLLVVLKEIMYY